MITIDCTVGNNLKVGSIDLEETRGVVRGPFGEILGFYHYKPNITTNERGSFYLVGNKTIELLLDYAEKMQQNGIDIHLYNN